MLAAGVRNSKHRNQGSQWEETQQQSQGHQNACKTESARHAGGNNSTEFIFALADAKVTFGPSCAVRVASCGDMSCPPAALFEGSWLRNFH
jgi:hypothetical protein